MEGGQVLPSAKSRGIKISINEKGRRGRGWGTGERKAPNHDVCVLDLLLSKKKKTGEKRCAQHQCWCGMPHQVKREREHPAFDKIRPGDAWNERKGTHRGRELGNICPSSQMIKKPTGRDETTPRGVEWARFYIPGEKKKVGVEKGEDSDAKRVPIDNVRLELGEEGESIRYKAGRWAGPGASAQQVPTAEPEFPLRKPKEKGEQGLGIWDKENSCEPRKGVSTRRKTGSLRFIKKRGDRKRGI